MAYNMNPQEMVQFLKGLAVRQDDETRDRLLQVAAFLDTLYTIVNRWAGGE